MKRLKCFLTVLLVITGVSLAFNAVAMASGSADFVVENGVLTTYTGDDTTVKPIISTAITTSSSGTWLRP